MNTITFVSTFPPIVCGIGTYTKYLTDYIPGHRWRIISFKLDDYYISDEDIDPAERRKIDYRLSFPYPSLPSAIDGDLIWFQHAFGMWGKNNENFLSLIAEVKKRGKKVAASFHTIHFQSQEMASGMCKKEEDLLRETLPLVDLLTVFTNGAYRAVIQAFPKYRKKVFVLRHGVHFYPKVDQKKARAHFLSYLMNQADLPPFQKEALRRLEEDLHSKETVLLGNYGFITQDKDPLKLFDLGRRVQEKLPRHRIITLYVGTIQRRRDNELNTDLPILEALKSVSNGKRRFFFELYILEEVFPLAFRALDFAAFWCHNATQSGRMAHAQGSGVCVVGRNCEGIGETLQLSGLPASETLEELAARIAQLVLNPGLKKEMALRSWEHAKRYCFANQAKRHLLLERALVKGKKIPTEDGDEIDEVYPGEIGYWRYRGLKESWIENIMK